MRRILTVLTAAMFAMIGLVVIAPSASAHHTTVSGSVVCNDNGTWKITWRVENWSGGGTATVTSSSRGIVPAGTTIANGSTATFSENVSVAATTSLEVKARWGSGNTATNTGSVNRSAFPTNCEPAEEPVTPAAPSVVDPTCTDDGRLVVPADTEKVRYTKAPGGNGPGTYTVTATAKPGFRIVGQAEWTLTVRAKKTGPECDVVVTPVAPEVTVINGCGVYGSINLPSTEGVTYELVEGDGREGAWKVVATAKPGYVLADGATKQWSGDLGEFVECPTPVTPVAPEVTEINGCGVYGSIGMVGTEGVSYQIVEGDGREGAWKVVATAEPGYVFTDGAVTEWSGDLGEYVECPTPVTPVAPAVTPISECGVRGSVVPAETEGVSYELVEGDGTQGPWRVVATVAPGYVLADGATAEWSGDLGVFRDCGVLPEEEEKPDTEKPDAEKPEAPEQGVKGQEERAKTQAGETPSDAVLPNTGMSALLLAVALLGLVGLLGGLALMGRRSSQRAS